MNERSHPVATYRLQLNRNFRFEDAQELIPYLSRLGVTHLYSSPILRAREGSTHGYDVVDPKTVNPDIGDEIDFRAMSNALHAYGMGLILDIVPNHLAASSAENPYWQELLMFGRSAPHAHWFDIDWRLADANMWGRVLVPVLGASLSRVLADDQLRVAWRDGRLTLLYFDHVLPLDPSTVPTVLEFGLPQLITNLPGDHPAMRALRDLVQKLKGLPRPASRSRGKTRLPIDEIRLWLAQIAQLVASSPQVEQWLNETAVQFGHGDEGRKRLRQLLQVQNYRLVYWRRAATAINYRRFFDINDLISVRQEDPQVFDETHELIGRWLRDGFVDGLRVDHLDGLRDPRDYLERLNLLSFR